MKHYIQLFLSIVCAAHVLAAESKIIAPGATLQKLAGDFAFTEGPACDARATCSSPTSPTTASSNGALTASSPRSC